MTQTIWARIVVDTDCPKAAEMYWAHVTEKLPKEHLIAASGSVFKTVDVAASERARLTKMAARLHEEAQSLADRLEGFDVMAEVSGV